ncbi:TrmB family transcriptional regulator [Halobacteriales archaeon QS_1_68_17]|nr:MAG: TrmB family transcriptional regulator [Halobacteriales archaeon QS_1_68_17]
MTGDDTRTERNHTEEAVGEAVETLQAFELTSYEAKCFVALTRIGQGTAKEVSEVADVPRARVYDCAETLQDRGLVDVQESKPRRFRAVDPSEAVAVLERDCRRRLDSLEELLPRLEAPAAAADDGTVWVMEGTDEVSERARRLVAGAESELLLALPVEELLTEELLSAAAAAADRGVSVTVGSPAEEIRERVREAVPSAAVHETWTWWESYPIQPGEISAIVMADGSSLLVSADVAGSLPGVYTHRAVWTDSDEAPIVGMMRPLLEQGLTAGPA